jgi:DNA helicase-2/ATP-dependent DNA helicase PcrA
MMLRRYAEEAGLDPSYSIYDTSDQRAAMKQALAKEGLDTANWTPASLLGHVSRAKNQLLSPDEYESEASDFVGRTVARAFKAYQRVLHDNHAVDFDDLLRLTADLFRTNATVREAVQQRFHYVLIDEYQDTNHAQFVIANAIASAHQNIFAVGDPDQSIYGWRGADIGNILDFERHYAGAEVVALGQNFRSTGHIVHGAGGLIEHNKERREKVLTTDLDDGELISIVGLEDEHHEARHVLDVIRKASDDGLAWREMAILYRINSLSRVLEEEFRRRGIPYVIARGTAFYDRREIRDALAFLRVIANPRDDVALKRIINTPPRGIGGTTLKRLFAHAEQNGLSLLDACLDVEACEGLAKRSLNAVRTFASMVSQWQERAENGGSDDLGDLVSMVLKESGMEKMDALASEEERQRQANLGELVSAASEFAAPSASDHETGMCSLGVALLEYLESVALVSDADMIDPERGAVTLMTLHAAKGLEYPFVTVVGLEDGLLPHQRANESTEELEEERRLLFVGMTRAERHLLLTSASVRTVRGMRMAAMRSRFLDEIPACNVDRKEEDIHAGAFDALGDSGIEYDEGAFDQEDLAAHFAPGTIVRHQQFGTGVIESFTPRRRVNAVTVRFKAIGRKTLVLEYARLTRIDA